MVALFGIQYPWICSLFSIGHILINQKLSGDDSSVDKKRYRDFRRYLDLGILAGSFISSFTSVRKLLVSM